ADPSKSNLQIAREIRADDKTVASVRRELEARSEIPNVETRTDTRGRKQPAKVVTPTKKKPRLSRWRSLQNKVRDLEAENRRLQHQATPLIPAWEAGEERRGDFDAQTLGGLQIDDQFEFRRQRDWQVGWLLALENPPGVDTNLSIGLREAPTVAHQAAGRDVLTQRVNSRQRTARRRRN